MNVIIEGYNNYLSIIRLVQAFYPTKKINKIQQYSYEGETLSIKVTEQFVEIKLFNQNIIVHENKKIIKKSSLSKKELRLLIQRMIVSLLSKHTKRKLPWGVLTGVRPVKIAYNYIEQNIDENEIKKQLKEVYLINEDKINTMFNIAKIEHQIINNYSKNDYSLYIGIPFCPTRCLYCSFTSYPIKNKHIVEAYLNALIKEIKFIGKQMKNNKLISIYIGGGTPTSFNSVQLNRLFYEIVQCFDLTYLDEWTVEAGRPDSINYDKLKIIKDYPISRISINPQTMNQKTLDIIGRKHTVEQTIECYKLARKLEFDNINMDIIIGLPEELSSDVINTLNHIKKLDPDSLTVHSLAIKRASVLKEKNWQKYLINEAEINKIQHITVKFAQKMSLHPYYLYRQKNIIGNLENIGYTKKGKESIYNILIIEEKQTIIAVGAGAVSKILEPNSNRIIRIENLKNIEHYIKKIDNMINKKKLIITKLS